MRNILIVCALEIETQGKLKEWEPHDILYTGVGKVNATYALTKRLSWEGSINHESRKTLVINYGTAGSRKIKKGKLVDCTKFIQRDMDVTGLGFMRGETPFEKEPPLMLESTSDFNPIGRHATCGTGDCFVEDKSQYYGEVVDMEGYALAKVCHNYYIPFISPDSTVIEFDLFVEIFSPILVSDKHKIVGQNIKYDLLILPLFV